MIVGANLHTSEECEVNSAQVHPPFTLLQEALSAPSENATVLMTNPKFNTWSRMCCHNVAWNFEKVLVGPDGVPVSRLSCFPAIDIEPDIKALLSRGPSVPKQPSYPCCLAVTALPSGGFIHDGVSSKSARRNA